MELKNYDLNLTAALLLYILEKFDAIQSDARLYITQKPLL